MSTPITALAPCPGMPVRPLGASGATHKEGGVTFSALIERAGQVMAGAAAVLIGPDEHVADMHLDPDDGSPTEKRPNA